MSQLWDGRARLGQEPGLEPEPAAGPPVFQAEDEVFRSLTAGLCAACWSEAPFQAALLLHAVCRPSASLPFLFLPRAHATSDAS